MQPILLMKRSTSSSAWRVQKLIFDANNMFGLLSSVRYVLFGVFRPKTILLLFLNIIIFRFVLPLQSTLQGFTPFCCCVPFSVLCSFVIWSLARTNRMHAARPKISSGWKFLCSFSSFICYFCCLNSLLIPDLTLSGRFVRAFHLLLSFMM